MLWRACESGSRFGPTRRSRAGSGDGGGVFRTGPPEGHPRPIRNGLRRYPQGPARSLPENSCDAPAGADIIPTSERTGARPGPDPTETCMNLAVEAQPVEQSARPPFQLRGGSYTMIVLRLIEPKHPAFYKLLTEKISQAPGFFTDAPVVLDLQDLANEPPFNMAELRRRLRQHRLMAFGVQNGTEEQNKIAENAGMVVLPEGRQAAMRPSPARQADAEAKPEDGAAAPVAAAEPAPAPASSKPRAASRAGGDRRNRLLRRRGAAAAGRTQQGGRPPGALGPADLRPGQATSSSWPPSARARSSSPTATSTSTAPFAAGRWPASPATRRRASSAAAWRRSWSPSPATGGCATTSPRSSSASRCRSTSATNRSSSRNSREGRSPPRTGGRCFEASPPTVGGTLV